MTACLRLLRLNLFAAATGRPYWFNVESGDSVWDLPAELAWTKVMDDTTG